MRLVLVGMVLVIASMLTLSGVASAQTLPPAPAQTAQDNHDSGWLVALLAMLGIAAAGGSGASSPSTRVPEPGAVVLLGLVAVPFIIRYVRR